VTERDQTVLIPAPPLLQGAGDLLPVTGLGFARPLPWSSHRWKISGQSPHHQRNLNCLFTIFLDIFENLIENYSAFLSASQALDFIQTLVFYLKEILENRLN
jgi:hypothetical protein